MAVPDNNDPRTQPVSAQGNTTPPDEQPDPHSPVTGQPAADPNRRTAGSGTSAVPSTSPVPGQSANLRDAEMSARDRQAREGGNIGNTGNAGSAGSAGSSFGGASRPGMAGASGVDNSGGTRPGQQDAQQGREADDRARQLNEKRKSHAEGLAVAHDNLGKEIDAMIASIGQGNTISLAQMQAIRAAVAGAHAVAHALAEGRIGLDDKPAA